MNGILVLTKTYVDRKILKDSGFEMYKCTFNTQVHQILIISYVYSSHKSMQRFFTCAYMWAFEFASELDWKYKNP